MKTRQKIGWGIFFLIIAFISIWGIIVTGYMLSSAMGISISYGILIVAFTSITVGILAWVFTLLVED